MTRGRKRGRILLWFVVGIVACALVAGGGVAVALHVNTSDDLPPGFPARPAAITLKPQINPVPDTAPIPSPVGVRNALAADIKAPSLGDLSGQVSDVLTGQVLWNDNASTPRIPASNTKILTASAVLLDLPHDKRLTTTVVEGTDGQAILKGAGDPTLSAQPPGAQTFYTNAARISDLAAQIKRSGVPVTSVAVDTSAFPGPTMDKTWDRADIAGGDIAPIESLMADGARTDPLNEYSPRTATPAETAGTALARALGVDAPVESVTAAPAARVLASVQSPTLLTMVDDMMRYSDNVLAETLGIELSTSNGGPATIAGGVSAVETALNKHGFDLSGVTLRDTSGLSYGNRVPAALLDQLMAAASGPLQPLMRPMIDGLPVAGGTGTLADRFDPKTNPGAGWVRAKTGTLTGVSSLTGIVQTVDGRVLSFALMSGGTSPADSRPALDAIPGKLRECGCR